jgi:hypothetical protein
MNYQSHIEIIGSKAMGFRAGDTSFVLSAGQSEVKVNGTIISNSTSREYVITN